MTEFATEYDGQHIGTIAERVTAGLDYLHREPQTDPDAIDLGNLDIGWGQYCPLGQAYGPGNYAQATMALGLSQQDARRYGFHAAERYNRAEWDALEAEWRRQLEAERQPA